METTKTAEQIYTDLLLMNEQAKQITNADSIDMVYKYNVSKEQASKIEDKTDDLFYNLFEGYAVVYQSHSTIKIYLKD